MFLSIHNYRETCFCAKGAPKNRLRGRIACWSQCRSRQC